MASTGPIPYYLDILSQWPSAIAIDSQWFLSINFDSLPIFNLDLIDIVREYENGSSSSIDWDVSSSVIKTLISKKYQSGHEFLACVFAEGVTLPSDSVDASNKGVSHAGFQGAATVSKRNDFKTFSVTFTETNASFVDLVIRPWLIAVSHLGFVTRDNRNLNVKALNLDVMYIAKTGSGSKPAYRKGFRFHGVAPISISNFTSRHSNVGLQSYTVEFIYDSYSVSAKQTNQLISNTQSTATTNNPTTNNPTTNNLWNLTGITPAMLNVSLKNNITNVEGGVNYAIFGDYSLLQPPKNSATNNNITLFDNTGAMFSNSTGSSFTNPSNGRSTGGVFPTSQVTF
jgi:hypothetical protein